MPMITRLGSGRGRRVNYVKLAGMKTRKPRISKPAAKAVKKIVKRVMSAETETKHASLAMNQTFNGTISSSSECYTIIPTVTQGVDDWQRVGDRIRPKYIYVKGYVQYDVSSGGNQYLPPATCRLLVLSQKNVKASVEIPTRIDTSHLLKDNLATGVGRAYTGTVIDNLAPINKELFTVHMDKKVKFNWQNKKGTDGIDPTVEWQTGNDRTKYFTLRLKCPKSLTYDTNTGDTPNNFAPFFCFGAVNDDASGPWTLTAPFRVVYLSTMYFEDA